jgi:hypothetical protein
VLAVLATGAHGAGPDELPSGLIGVGPGVTENSQRQVVRTRDDIVYIASVDDDQLGGGTYADLHMYRATSAGVPDAFTSADAADDPRVQRPLTLSGGDSRIDGDGTIHSTYAVTNLTGEAAGVYDAYTTTVIYQTFDTRTDAWGHAEPIVTLPADGDGVRGKVVSGIALAPSGAPLVVTASSSGVSAWSRTSDGGWERAAVDSRRGIHPSLAFDASGRAQLAWLSAPYGDSVVRYAARSASGDWSAPETIASGDVLTNDTSDQGPSLAFDSAARPVVVWLDARDDVRVGRRADDRTWTRDDPQDTFAHAPGIGMHGDAAFIFLGHDIDAHPAYLSRAAGGAWSDVSVFPPVGVDGFYSYDGSASVRFDPLFDTDCATIDSAFFSEYSQTPGRVGKPDLYYAAVSLRSADAACRAAPEPQPTPTATPTPEPTATPTPEPTATPEPPTDGEPSLLLGHDEIAPQPDANRAGMAEAFASVAADSATVSSITVYVDTGSAADTITVGLYDDRDGHPGALLTEGHAAADGSGWATIPVTGTDLTAGKQYWIALLGTGDGGLRFRDEPQGECASETTPESQTLDALPAEWRTGTEYDDCPVSAYGAG